MFLQPTNFSCELQWNPIPNGHKWCPLNVSATWAKDWELDFNPAKSEYLPIGNFVTYMLPSHNPPNTQTIPSVSTTKALEIVLNTGLSAEDNVISAANKALRMLPNLSYSQ